MCAVKSHLNAVICQNPCELYGQQFFWTAVADKFVLKLDLYVRTQTGLVI